MFRRCSIWQLNVILDTPKADPSVQAVPTSVDDSIMVLLPASAAYACHEYIDLTARHRMICLWDLAAGLSMQEIWIDFCVMHDIYMQIADEQWDIWHDLY